MLPHDSWCTTVEWFTGVDVYLLNIVSDTLWYFRFDFVFMANTKNSWTGFRGIYRGWVTRWTFCAFVENRVLSIFYSSRDWNLYSYPLHVIHSCLFRLVIRSRQYETSSDWRKINKLCCIFFDNIKKKLELFLFSLRHRSISIAPTFFYRHFGKNLSSENFYLLPQSFICGWNFLIFNLFLEISFLLIYTSVNALLL